MMWKMRNSAENEREVPEIVKTGMLIDTRCGGQRGKGEGEGTSAFRIDGCGVKWLRDLKWITEHQLEGKILRDDIISPSM